MGTSVREDGILTRWRAPAMHVRSLIVAACAIGLTASTRGGTTIVVHTGPFPSVEAAATGEAKVNWLDADPADDRACTECFAAVELQRCLRRMTGRVGDFAVANDAKDPGGNLILVGGPASNAVTGARAAELELDAKAIATLGPEGYILKCPGVNAQRSSIVVAGGGRVGTLYGAYDLLYRLGCRWFAPGDVHEQIPRAHELDLFRQAIDVTETPAFRTRGFHAWQDRGDPDFLLWMARNRLNYWCVEQGNHPLSRCPAAAIPPRAFFSTPRTPIPTTIRSSRATRRSRRTPTHSATTARATRTRTASSAPSRRIPSGSPSSRASASQASQWSSGPTTAPPIPTRPPSS